MDEILITSINGVPINRAVPLTTEEVFFGEDDQVEGGNGLEQEAATAVEPEAQKDVWEANEFQSVYRQLIGHFETLESRDTLDSRTRELMSLIGEATTVSEFDSYSDDQLNSFLSQIHNVLPRLERNFSQFDSDMARSRAVVADIDFI